MRGARACTLSGILAVSLLSGCFMPIEWENATPEDLTVALDPSPPVPGEDLSVLVTAPVQARIAIVAMSFEGFGTKSVEATGDEVSLQLGAATEGDFLVYWAGAYQRDENETATLHLTDPVYTQVGEAAPLDLEVQIETYPTPGPSPGVTFVVNVTDAPEGIEVSGMEYAFRGTRTMSQPEPHPFQSKGNGTFERNWTGVMGDLLDEEDKDNAWTVTLVVLARDPDSGAAGFAFDRMIVR